MASLRGQIKYLQYTRVERGLHDPIYLLNVNENDKELQIAGTTRNVYTVKYQPKLSCDCPDNRVVRRGGPFLCKHICFVICKICKFDDPTIFETFALSAIQVPILEEKLMQAGGADEDIVDMLLLDRFHKLKIGSDAVKVGRALDDSQECPICFGILKGTEITACRECGNYVHDDCLKRWLAIKSTCVYCRSYLHSEEMASDYLQLY
jgi:hypothetical protein